MTQDEIAREVFRQDETDADDATVRVYIHRLRKKIDNFYAMDTDIERGWRIALPSGTYALRLETDPEFAPTVRSRWGMPALLGSVITAAVMALVFAFVQRPAFPNAIWQPLAHSDRPVLLVIGDYYLFGEIDPVRPEYGRLIRDFRVNGPEGLAALQQSEPARYGNAEDVGLNYLPFSSAYALRELLPMLSEAGKDVTVIAGSSVKPDMLNYFDVVYVGLLSGMHVLEEQTFRTSGFKVGESYDELTDRRSGRAYISNEARSLTSPAFYEDYAYLARYTAPTGAAIIVVASERDTGLRAVSPVVAGADLPDGLADVSPQGSFEALIAVTGQQGADLSHRTLIVRARP
ncbi:hypothetical protein GCM10011411_02120 [Aurantiacibacter arachoides]|nr:hypothetical protein GCM10011411_02120 [Aurantiacibacter arachoides]